MNLPDSKSCLTLAIPTHNDFWDVDRPSVIIAFFVSLASGAIILLLLARWCLPDIIKHRVS